MKRRSATVLGSIALHGARCGDRSGVPATISSDDGGQALVEAAILAQGLLRAAVLGGRCRRVKAQVVSALEASRRAADPKTNNWVMFAAWSRRLAGVRRAGGPRRLEDNVRLMIG